MPFGPGAPTNSGIAGYGSAFGLTAHAGGGNANALLLTSWMNTVTTVATAADSVMLPPGYGGAEIVVINHGANSLQVFGFQSTAPGDIVTDTIAPAGSITQGIVGVAVASGGVGLFYCMLGQAGQTNGISPAQWQHKLLT